MKRHTTITDNNGNENGCQNACACTCYNGEAHTLPRNSLKAASMEPFSSTHFTTINMLATDMTV